jgi:hypothetical protein
MSVAQPAAWDQGGWLRGEVEPLAGNARLRPAASCELAVEHRAAFAEGLAQLGLSDPDRADVLRLRDSVAGEVLRVDADYAAIARASCRPAPVHETIAIVEARRTAYGRLAAWFADRRVEVRARATSEVRIPLFVLGAPDVAGCRAALWPAGTPRAALSARFTLCGTGGGDGAIGYVSVTDAVCAGRGTSRVVFVPVKVAVAKVTVYDNYGLVGRGLQVSIAGAPRTAGAFGLQLETDASPPVGRFVHTYALGDERSKVFAYERIPTQTQPEIREVRLPISIDGMEAVVTAAVELSSPGMLTLDLAGGHDYDLYEVARGHGFLWRTG